MANLGDIRINNDEVFVYIGGGWKKCFNFNDYDNDFIKELIKENILLKQCIQELKTKNVMYKNTEYLFD